MTGYRLGVDIGGTFTDVTILDTGSIREHGTIFEPNRLATGVHHVLVNGELALSNSP